ncbi:MAG: sigma-54-dependent Fis family transcriptional regulator [Deltaproteobacteria bacterium]|nr:sigma-54-dependent Fis family transcriptional regulator [Deltaproteobacteria bacterium]
MTARGKIMLVDDDPLIVATLSRWFRKQGYEIQPDTKCDDVLGLVNSFLPDIVLLDIKLPVKNGIEILQEITASRIDTKVIMLTSDDTAETAIKAMKLGAVDYLTKPFNLEEVGIVIDKVFEKDRLEREVQSLRLVHSDLSEAEFIGASDAAGEIREKIRKMVQARVSTLLITGESGTGKEVIARFLHRSIHGEEASRRAPFIPVNCTALPESLLESELFGYEKGAFTDAKADKKGVFEMANKGTILLDEIGDMKQNCQTKLLRIVERKAVRRIGGGSEIPVDVAVIATTNRDLVKGIETGDFRMDLYYRLNAFSINIPPLRERREDIPVLAEHFLSYFRKRYNKCNVEGFSPEAAKMLTTYRWPGNVRELKNVIERLVVLENADTIRPEHLPKEMVRTLPSPESGNEVRFLLPESGISLDDVERDFIVQALDRSRQNKSVAAKLLNVTYQSLRYQIKKFGLE